MPIREILRYPHPGLKAIAAALEPGEDARRLAADLETTMRAFPGCVGIAAPQIAEPWRMVVVDVTGHPKAGAGSGGLLVLANPQIVAAEGSQTAREGCLSIPDFTANVRRATSVEVEAVTPSGEPVSLRSEGFEARCLLHEIDHLDGLLFLDRVESVRDDVFPRKRSPGGEGRRRAP